LNPAKIAYKPRRNEKRKNKYAHLMVRADLIEDQSTLHVLIILKEISEKENFPD
jgi:hypothetical protein